MANLKQAGILRKGVDTWNASRKQASYGRPQSGLCEIMAGALRRAGPCRSVLLALVLAATLTSVGRAHAAAANTRAADEAALRNADEDRTKAAQTKDVAAWMALYADDAVVLPPNGKMAVNRRDIAKSIGNMLALPGLIAIGRRSAKVEAARSGDLGYVQGTYTASFRNPNGETVNDRGKYLEVWRKQADGSWKCIVDTWNSDLPP